MSRQERETVERVTTVPPPGATTVPPEATTGYRERVEGPVTWEEMRALLRREPYPYERTWKATTGGILAIIGGTILLAVGGSVLGVVSVINDLLTDAGITTTVSSSVGIPFLVLGAIAIIGGILAIARRLWGLALIGSIATLFGLPLLFPFLMGVLSVIFVALARPEFNRKARDIYRT